MTLYLKHKDFVTGEYFEVNSFYNVITDRMCDINGLCEEEYIIEKIKKNEDGFFDFSKSFIDIGSEDGAYAMFLTFKENHCFEPNKNMCCLIYTNMWLKDKVDNTNVYNVALGKDDGISTFNGFVEGSSPMFDLMTDRGFGKEPYFVERRKLDDYELKNVGLIKIDVEGSEYDVILGAEKTIVENDFPPILFEMHPEGEWGETNERRDKLIRLIKSFGYEIIECYGGDDRNHLAVKKR